MKCDNFRQRCVGISPFGIWRPGSPAGVVGLDAYADIYADSRTWLERGWLDYLAPQLYWSIASTGQSFPGLLDWWSQQNTMRRHLWPGLAAYRVADGTSSAYSAGEITAQISLTRARSGNAGGPTGSILYNTSTLLINRGGVTSALQGGVFTAAALVPATTWLDGKEPAAPAISLTPVSGSLTLQRLLIEGDGGEPLSWWAVRWHAGNAWTMRVIAADVRAIDIPVMVNAARVDVIVVQAIDRAGNASVPAVWRSTSH